MRRRTLLAAAAAGLSAAVLPRRRARAAWGTWPEDQQDLALPEDRRAHDVLELFVYGGLCPWDTFYCPPAWGAGEARYLHAFGEAPLTARADLCGLSGDLTRPFAADDNGTPIHLGPWTAPLWQRPDLLARTRVLLTRHDQFPHATAIPLALTGSPLGRPTLAGTAAPVGRHFAELEGGAAPRAVVVHPGDLARLDNIQSALAVGRHPRQSRPLELALARLPHLVDLLDRPATADHRQAHDQALAALTARFEARLRAPDGALLPAPDLQAFAAVDALRREPTQLAALLPDLLGVPLGAACGVVDPSITALGARVATHALCRGGARYALWVDAGLRPALDGGHDTHRDHLDHAPPNYAHTLAALADRINAPGEDDPDKLDLDRTLIAITSEFGRTPTIEDDRNGLGHWPHAGVTVLLGGPVRAPAVIGAVDPQSALATAFATPTEIRMALLMALGIHPLAPDAFLPTDAHRAADPRAALLRLRTLLGVPS